MYRVELNTSIPYNYSFYCPIAKISLNPVNKSALVHELTPSIRRGIIAKTLFYKEIIVEKEKDGIEVSKEETKVKASETVINEEKLQEEPKEEEKPIKEEKPKKETKRKRKTSDTKSSKK